MLWQQGHGCHFASKLGSTLGRWDLSSFAMIIKCHDLLTLVNKIQFHRCWQSHVSSAQRKIGHRHCTKPLLHILLSWFVNIVSVASIIIWGFHLLFLYNKHSSAPLVKAGGCRGSAVLRKTFTAQGLASFQLVGWMLEWQQTQGWDPSPAWEILPLTKPF